MNAPQQGEETIFAEALRLPPEERAAYLAQSTHGNAELRQRVESLLGSYATGEFLEEAAAPQLRETRNVTVPLTEKPGDTIGRYKLLQQIGEGGCGVVYMAEQAEPVRRRVALKIIKLGMDTKSVIARFEAERQAVAMMDHPNIAKVFDAGATEAGRPYFVMELVRGMKITEYCDEAKLSTRARLDLFIQVCQAIQHAHQKGIIHRDIKPSNILVTVNDGVAVPKVIDFGIAKATSGQQLTDKTVFTAFEQFIGTPAYMSPEQAVLTSLDIDTRSDIYALGVLLYEMLTDKTPFDAKELFAIGLDEMRRTIREQEPPRPSTRLSTLPGQELSTAAQRRGLDAPKLVSELRGDLDWIVMKALEKDRARRYETANGLASDIRRHLNNEPVVACPPSKLYRLQKTVRRNKLAFAAAAAIAAALVTGLGISTWLFLKERTALKRAVAAEQAERKLRQEAELRELNARAYQLSSSVFDPESAIAARRKTLEAQRKLLGKDHSDVAGSLEELANLFAWQKKFPEAEQAGHEALAIRRRNSPDEDLSLAESLNKLGGILFKQLKYPEAEELYGEAVKIRRRLQGDENVDTAISIQNLAAAIGNQHRPAEALALFKQAFATDRKLLPDGNVKLALVGRSMLEEMINVGQLSEAAEFVRDFVPQHEKARSDLIDLVARLARDLFTQGRSQDAERMLNELAFRAPDSRTILRVRAEYRAQHGRWREAIVDFIQITQAKPEKQNHTPIYDEDCHKLATLLVQIGDLEGYREYCRKAVERFGGVVDVPTAHRISKDCLILPDTGVDLGIVDRMADRCIAGGQSGPFSCTKALAEYRQGRFASAAEWAEKTRPYYAWEVGWIGVQASATLAMARHRLGQSDLAQAALAKAQNIADQHLPMLDIADVGSHWLDVIISHALLREAKALIQSTSETKAETK
jgi:eukaryotic-like serine/threonine-protein kinase